MKRPRLFLLIALIGFIFSISAQENPLSETPVKNRTEFEEKASALVDEILLEIPQLESKENQITATTLMIDLLWKRDEKRARELALETAAKIRSALSPVFEKDEQLRAFLMYPPMQYKDLRADFVLRIVTHDAEFARSLAASTEPSLLKAAPKTPSEQITIFNWQKDERDLEQKMAFRLAKTNIDGALVISRRSLKIDSSQESLNVLRRLQFKDAKTADAFADEIIQGLLTEDFTKDREAHETTAVFFRQLDPQNGVFGGMLSCTGCSLPKALNLNPQKIRRLAAKWTDFAVTLDDEKAAFYLLPVVPLLEKLVPEKKAALKAKIAAIEKNAPKRFESEQIEEKIFDNKTTAEELLKMALTKKSRERFQLYREAFVKAANTSKAALERIQEVIAAHPESEEKRWLADEIAANLAGKTAEDGHLELALEMAQKVSKRDRRIGLLSFLALEFKKKGETEKAKQIAEEIAVLMDLSTKDKMPKAIVGYDVFSSIFFVFALTNTPHAFDFLELTLPDAGESFFNRYPDLRSLINQNSYRLSSYSKPVSNLARADFERTKRLLLYFKRPEISILAKFYIAQALLEEKFEWGNLADYKEMVVIKN